jgi:hypothetical protein
VRTRSTASHAPPLRPAPKRPRQNALSDDPEEDRKLMFGLLFSLKLLCEKLSPQPSMDGLQCFKTDVFCLHHFETASGIKLILNTDRDVGDMTAQLKHIYSNIYVEYVVKNPLHTQQMLVNGAPITCKLFTSNLRKYIEGLPCA